MKTVKRRLFKKYFKRRKSWHVFVSLLVRNKSVGAGAHKAGKVVGFWPNFDPNFPDIWRV